jgi:hypothetical protein
MLNGAQSSWGKEKRGGWCLGLALSNGAAESVNSSASESLVVLTSMCQAGGRVVQAPASGYPERATILAQAPWVPFSVNADNPSLFDSVSTTCNR